jgi:hypothetical protein
MNLKAKLAIFVTSVFTVCLTLAVVIYFVFLNSFVFMPHSLYMGRPDASNLGDTSWVSGINSSMSAVEMFLIGIENANVNAPFVAIEQQGRVSGNILGVEFNNILGSTRIRDGENAFFQTYTFGMNNVTALNHDHFEQGMRNNGMYFHQVSSPRATRPVREADGNFTIMRPEVWSASNLNITQAEFSELSATVLGLLSMHTFNANTIINPTAPVYNRSAGVYTYRIYVCVETGLDDYERVVASTKPPNHPMLSGTLRFVSVALNVTQWDNGLIKQIEWEEEYRIGAIRIFKRATSWLSYSREQNAQYYNFGERAELFV